ncbi:MAG: S-layer homology domain-containing protein [Eubacteriales bacterium]|nr:S-layer homology domain-containing protein [Eubacteriales bacterium]
MKKRICAILLISLLMLNAFGGFTVAQAASFSEFKTVVADLRVTGSSVARDVAITGGGRYALVLLSGTPSTVAKIDLLTKEVVETKAIGLDGVKGIEVDEAQNVYFVSSVTGINEGNEKTQSIYVYSLNTMEQVGVVNYKTPINKDQTTNKYKTSDLYNISLKKLGGKTYLYAVHQGTGYHAQYPQYFYDDVICRIDVTDYNSPVMDTSFGSDGYLYLEEIITDGDPAKLFDVTVMDDGRMIVARHSDNNNKISLFLIDADGTVINSKFIKNAKYVELASDYAIVSLTGGKSITAIDPETLEPVSDVLPASISSLSYAGAAYDAKNDILYIATDSSNSLLATGDYTEQEDEEEQPSLEPGNQGIKGYFPYAYFYGYSTGEAGPNDNIKREEASALLYRILKQQKQTDNFTAGEATYADIRNSHWAFQAVEYMHSVGVFEATENFFPSRPISRAEIAKMIALSLGYGTDNSKKVSFTDLTIDNPYFVYVKAMADNNIFIGNGNSTVNPNGMMTRAEFVTTINRLIKRDTENFDISNTTVLFPDITPSHWAYDALILATNGFSGDVDDETGKYTIDAEKRPPRETIDFN